MENGKQTSSNQNNATLAPNQQENYQPLDDFLGLTMNSILPEGEMCDLSSNFHPENVEGSAEWAPTVSTMDSPAATQGYAQIPTAGLAVGRNDEGISTPQASEVDREETTIPLYNVGSILPFPHTIYRLLTVRLR